MARKSDQQVERSREWLCKSLLSLMKEKPYSEITILEIAQRADLNRRTFYRHFKSKDEILSYQVQQLADQYDKSLVRDYQLPTEEVARAFLTICQENREFCGLLRKHRLMPLFLDQLNDIFVEFHRKYHTESMSYQSKDEPYAIAFFVGGFWNIVNYWLSEEQGLPVDELVKLICSFLPPYI